MVENKTKRGRGRPRNFDPDEVLDKVIDVFWELGYDAADTETLAEQAGLTKPSLYNAFGSKEELFAAALNRYQTARSAASLQILTSATTPSEGLRDYYLHLADCIAAPDRPKGCLMLSIALPLMDRLPKVAAEIKSAPQESRARMKRYFAEQIEKGNLPSDFKSDQAISLISDLAAAMITQARAGAPLETLKALAPRNAGLVLHIGTS